MANVGVPMPADLQYIGMNPGGGESPQTPTLEQDPMMMPGGQDAGGQSKPQPKPQPSSGGGDLNLKQESRIRQVI